jgi:PTS system nitrogen regulatory IIA component
MAQLTIRDVAALLDVPEKTVYRWIQQEQLPAYELNDQYRFNRAELLEWATSKKLNVSSRLFSHTDTGGTAQPGLAAALETGGIVYRLPGTDKPSALRAMVDAMRLPEEVDRTILLQVLLAREEVGSTGIGEGIALPHARSPIVLHVVQPMMVLCFLERPIAFGAPDGQPVHTLFALITPSVRTHLHLVSALAFALRDEGFRAAIRRQAPGEEILREARRVDAGTQGIAATPNGARG